MTSLSLNDLYRVASSPTDEQNLLKIDSILKVLGVEGAGDVEKLLSYFLADADNHELIHPNDAIKAIKAFVEEHQAERQRGGDSVKTAKREAGQEGTRREEREFWERMSSIISDKTYRVWCALEKSLHKYDSLLKNRGGLIVNYKTGGTTAKRAKGGSKFKMPAPPYRVNFVAELALIIRESKYLDRMGFAVPETALNVTLQEDKYHEYVESLNAMLGAYRTTLESLSPVETELLRDRIAELLADLAGRDTREAELHVFCLGLNHSGRETQAQAQPGPRRAGVAGVNQGINMQATPEDRQVWGTKSTSEAAGTTEDQSRTLSGHCT